MNISNVKTDRTIMALIYRADLPEMTRAKSEIQAAHGAVELTHRLTLSDPSLIAAYLESGQKKGNFEVDDQNALMVIAKKATDRGVPYFLVEDSGKTIFGCPTVTCLLMGPMTKTDLNSLTKKARMRDRDRILGPGASAQSTGD